METRTRAPGSSPEMLPWFGAGDPIRTAGKKDKPLRYRARSLEEPAWTKKARSVVALSRVPRGVRGAPVSPPAAGRGAKEEVLLLSSGGCPASCPDAHRPTHGHRHVRNRASPQVIHSATMSSALVRRCEISNRMMSKMFRRAPAGTRLRRQFVWSGHSVAPPTAEKCVASGTFFISAWTT